MWASNLLFSCNFNFSGDEQWPYGSYLKFVGGNRFGDTEYVMVESLGPGACTDITVDMVSPVNTGVYQGEWRMCTASGLFFGGQLVS